MLARRARWSRRVKRILGLICVGWTRSAPGTAENQYNRLLNYLNNLRASVSSVTSVRESLLPNSRLLHPTSGGTVPIQNRRGEMLARRARGSRRVKRILGLICVGWTRYAQARLKTNTTDCSTI